MSWYKLAKDYIEFIEKANPSIHDHFPEEPEEEETIEEQLSEQLANKPFSFPVTQMLNSVPDTMKASGQGALYNSKSHIDNNMPEGGDNFIKPTAWN
jgi:hypothetical protein